MASTNSSTRHRNFATIVYPESAPENWQSILDDFHIPAFISPLHDKDLDKNGNLKKAHFHVLVMFDGVKTNEQVLSIFSAIGGVGLEVIKNLSTYSRYLCHLDSVDKVKYLVDDVVCLGGADYTSEISLPSDKHRLIREMITFCKDSHIYAFPDLMDYASENRTDWFELLCDNSAYVMERYIKGLYFKECKLESFSKTSKFKPSV